MSQETSPSFCYVHPDREASLRCNRCDRPICPNCAVRTPTGYRCKECIRGQQKIFDTSQPVDFPLAFFTSAVLSLIGSILASLLASLIGLWGLLLVSGLGTAAGAATAEVVRRVIRKHRSPALFRTAAGGAAAGALPVILYNIINMNIWGLIIAAAFAILVTTAVFYRLRGIQVR